LKLLLIFLTGHWTDLLKALKGTKNLVPMNKIALARLAGFLFSDGSMYYSARNNYYEISFSVGCIDDAKSLESDLSHLGAKCHIDHRLKEFKIAGRPIKMHTYRVKILSKELFSLFENLGAPVGKKTDKKYEVPKWVLEGERKIQREFLSGFLGGDGPKVTIFMQKRNGKQPCNSLKINDIEFFKRIDLLNNGICFAKQISSLLENLGVQVNRIFNKGNFKRKDNTFSTSIHIRLSQTIETAVSYLNISFAYCKQKNIGTRKVKMFLEEILRRRIVWRQKYIHALSLYKEGLSIKEVAERAGVSYAAAFGWIRYNRKPTVEPHYLKFDKWGKIDANIK
jgi:intein/homing endonuclease